MLHRAVEYESRDSSVGRARPWWVANPAHFFGNRLVNPELRSIAPVGQDRGTHVEGPND